MAGKQSPDRGFEGFGDLFEAQAPDVTEMEDLLIRLRKPLKALEKLAIWKEPSVRVRRLLPVRRVLLALLRQYLAAVSA